jgi:hypothetical protein
MASEDWQVQGTNPSSRRGGIAIRFWCEGCPFISELTLAQHKGSTEVEWPTVSPQRCGSPGSEY